MSIPDRMWLKWIQMMCCGRDGGRAGREVWWERRGRTRMMQSGHRDRGRDTRGPRASRLLAPRHGIRRGKKIRRIRRTILPGSPRLSTKRSVRAMTVFLTTLRMWQRRRKYVARGQGRSRYGRKTLCVDPELLRKRPQRYDICIPPRCTFQ